jgi:hypothetical protein
MPERAQNKGTPPEEALPGTAGTGHDDVVSRLGLFLLVLGGVTAWGATVRRWSYRGAIGRRTFPTLQRLGLGVAMIGAVLWVAG